MPNEEDNGLYDVRLLRARFESGVLTKQQYEQYLASLPDDAGEAAPTDTRFHAQWQDRHRDSDGDRR